MLEYFKSVFDVVITNDAVRKASPKILEQVRNIGKRTSDVKKDLLKTFSKAAWEKLSVSD